MDVLGQYVFPLLTTIIAIGAIFLSTGKMLHKLENFDSRIEKAEVKIDNIEKEMMIKGDCLDRHRDMSGSFCRKIDEIKSMMEKIEEKRDRAVEINDERWMKVFAKLGEL